MPTKSPVLRLRHILVPVDFSPNARQALRMAIPLAAKFHARITLLHVIEPIVYPSEMGIAVPDRTDTAAASRKQLAMLAHKFIPRKLHGKTAVRHGQPYFEIAEAARQLKMDLIVLTTHGYSGLKRILLGGTAERVVRYAACPVLTVRIR
jgi:universal stress protein A